MKNKITKNYKFKPLFFAFMAISIFMAPFLRSGSIMAVSGFSYDSKVQMMESPEGGMSGVNYGFGYTVDPDGEITAQTYNNYYMLYYNPDGTSKKVVNLFEKFSDPDTGTYYTLSPNAPATFGKDGSVYFYAYRSTSSDNRHGVLKLKPKTADIDIFYELPDGQYSNIYDRSPVVGDDGKVYITSSNNDGTKLFLYVYSLSGEITNTIEIPINSDNYRNYYSFSKPNNNYIYLDGYDNSTNKTEIYRINTETGEQKVILSLPKVNSHNYQYGIRSDSKGNFFMFDADEIDMGGGSYNLEYYLVKYSEDGELLGRSKLLGNPDPSSATIQYPSPTIFFDSNDNVYVRTFFLEESSESGVWNNYRNVSTFGCDLQPIGNLSFKDLYQYANNPDEFHDNASSGVIIANDKLYWNAHDPLRDGSENEYMKSRSLISFNLPSSSCNVEPEPEPDEGDDSEEILVPNTGVKNNRRYDIVNINTMMGIK